MTGPGWTMRPEIPEDRRPWRPKPWVDRYKHYKPGRSRHAVIYRVSPPRGRLTHHPDLRAFKAALSRQLQGKVRR